MIGLLMAPQKLPSRFSCDEGELFARVPAPAATSGVSWLRRVLRATRRTAGAPLAGHFTGSAAAW